MLLPVLLLLSIVSTAAVGSVYLYGDGRVPYQHAVGAQVHFSSRGLQGHYVRYDGPRLLGPLPLGAGLHERRAAHSFFRYSGWVRTDGWRW